MFELRKLKSDDMFLMFSILSKIGFNDIKQTFTPDKLKEILFVFKQENEEKEDIIDMGTALGFGVVMDVSEIIFRNLPSCKTEIYSFLASLSGMTAEQIADLDMVTFTEMVIAVVQKEDFKDFFKVVAKLFK